MKSVFVLACMPVLCASAFGDTKPKAKQAASVDLLDARVMLSSPGSLVLDRGSVDLVAIGDAVVLTLKDGTTKRGAVTKVADRSSTVKLDDKAVVVPTGTRGTVELPKSRREPPKKPAPPPTEPGPKPPDAKQPEPKPAPTKPATDKPATKPEAKATDPKAPSGKPPATVPDHAEWQNKDKDWSKSMALLSPIRPDARASTMTGRLYSSAQYVRSAGGRTSDSYIRAGGELTAENLFGDGATLHVEGEVDHRAESDGGHGIGVLPYQVSYTWGGTRFDPARLEVGRFLQHGMPEFGVVDGAEYTRRLDDGCSVGASIGWMPEPDDDFSSFHDFQIAAYYHWASDNSEHLNASVGFEKTFNDWRSDRDLLVANSAWAIDSDTDFHGATWLDLYDSGDDDKSSAIEVTQAILVLSRRFGSDAGGNLTFRHLQFPQLDRSGEFTPITAAEIEDNHLDELSGSAFDYLESRSRLHGQVGVWNDEDERGGSADAGIELPEFLIDDLKSDFTGFGSRGQFTTVFGGRVTCSLPADDGRWDLSYEYANHRLHRAPSDQNDLVQQQVFLSRYFHWDRGWSLSLNASATWWDTDVSWSVGWYVQKSF